MKRLLLVTCCVLCVLLSACASPVQPADPATTTSSTATTTTTTTTTITSATTTTKAEERVQHLGLYRADSLTPLYEKVADERIYPASLAKITTAYTALYYVSGDTAFTVGSELSLVKTGSSVCRIARGHTLTLRDLIAGLMISSGNDAAYTIAVNVARQVADNPDMSDREAVTYFCDLMNQTARSLGATHSHYVNPDGWDDSAQYTTVQDLAILIREAMQLPEVSEAVACAEKTVSVGGGAKLTFRSTNQFLHRSSSFYDERVTGFKTGSTGKAGKCLAVTLTHNGVVYIAIVTNCPTDTDRYRTMQQLLNRIP